MQWRNSVHRYGTAAQVFHWIIVALIITQFVSAWIAADLPLGLQRLVLLARHKSIGITIMALAALRLLWRFMNPVPGLPPSTTRWQRIAVHASHSALYILLFAVPLFGWLMSSARNYTVSWFNLFALPNLVSPSDMSFAFFQRAHDVLAMTLLAIAIVHTLAALKHEFVDKDNVLRRMLPLRFRGDIPQNAAATRRDSDALQRKSA